MSLRVKLAIAEDEPEFAPARLGELQAIALDPSAAREGLGWAPATALPDGIAITVDWIRRASA